MGSNSGGHVPKINCCDGSVHETAMMDEIYKDIHEVVVEDPTVLSVIRQFEQRSQVGMKTYGTTMTDNPLSTHEWINHAQQEAMDLILYLERLKSNV